MRNQIPKNVLENNFIKTRQEKETMITDILLQKNTMFFRAFSLRSLWRDSCMRFLKQLFLL